MVNKGIPPYLVHDCWFCGRYCSENDPTVYRQVKAWVHGPKLDGATLRELTPYLAHNDCIVKTKAGQAADQEELDL